MRWRDCWSHYGGGDYLIWCQYTKRIVRSSHTAAANDAQIEQAFLSARFAGQMGRQWHSLHGQNNFKDLLPTPSSFTKCVYLYAPFSPTLFSYLPHALGPGLVVHVGHGNFLERHGLPVFLPLGSGFVDDETASHHQHHQPRGRTRIHGYIPTNAWPRGR